MINGYFKFIYITYKIPFELRDRPSAVIGLDLWLSDFCMFAALEGLDASADKEPITNDSFVKLIDLGTLPAFSDSL